MAINAYLPGLEPTNTMNNPVWNPITQTFEYNMGNRTDATQPGLPGWDMYDKPGLPSGYPGTPSSLNKRYVDSGLFGTDANIVDEVNENETWTLPQRDWGPVRQRESLPQRGMIDMFLQRFGVPPMTQVTAADKLANQQFMQEQGIGRDPQTGRMIGGDFEGMNAPGKSGWGSANFGEMAQNWMDDYGDVEYSVGVIGDMKRKKQDRMKQAAEQFRAQQEVQRQERIRNQRAAASAANQMTQRRPGRGGSHMSRSRDQGGLGISASQAQAVSDANRAAGMGGWGLAHGGRVGYNTGGRVGILGAF